VALHDASQQRARRQSAGTPDNRAENVDNSGSLDVVAANGDEWTGDHHQRAQSVTPSFRS